MMSHTFDNLLLFENDFYTIVELPFAKKESSFDISMLLILPSETKTVKSILDSLENTLEDSIKKLNETYVQVKIYYFLKKKL